MKTQGISTLMGTDMTASQGGTAKKASGSSFLKDASFSSYLAGNTVKGSSNQKTVAMADKVGTVDKTGAVDKTGSVRTERVKLTAKDRAGTGTQTGNDVRDAGKMTSAQTSDPSLTEPEEVDISAAEEQIAALLAQIFGMTENEVKDILAQDGNSISDLVFQIEPDSGTVGLVNTDALRQLVMDVHGVDDPSAFLMNDTLCTELTEITDAVTEVVADMFGVAPEELDTVEETLALSFVDQLVSQMQTTSDTGASQAENEAVTVSAAAVQQEPADDKFTVTVEDYTQTAGNAADTVAGTGETVSAGNYSSDSGSQNRGSDSEGAGTTAQAAEQTGETKSILPESATPETMRQTFTEQLTQAFGEVAEDVQAPEAVMNRIVEQIVRQVRIRVLPETTSMEMQLTPAALGRVNLQVSMTGGVSTASMTVETQAAKEALESQMIQLKETFAEQGLKVDAVEVTVSEFGLKQDQGQGQAQEQQNRQNSRRAFREDAGAEVLEDTERHTTESSRRDVNSVVDYTA